MPALAKRIEIDDGDRAELERIVRSTTQQVRMVERAQIVLAAAEGHSAAEIGRLVGCSVNTAQKWRSRYEADGLAGLGDLPRSGKPLIYSQADRARLVFHGWWQHTNNILRTVVAAPPPDSPIPLTILAHFFDSASRCA